MKAQRVDEDCFGLYRLKGWKIEIGLLTVRATRADETGSYGLTFHAEDGEYTTLTGRGAFSTIRAIRPAIVEIDRLTSGNWHACCDDPKRERVYRRWLPAERIVHE